MTSVDYPRLIVINLFVALHILTSTPPILAKPPMIRQIYRTIKYDRAANERNAIPGLSILNDALSWYRLDDGVMGGQSETIHAFSKETNSLEFKGEINTNGGGFCSIRSKIPSGLPSDTVGLRLKLRGDGKTYKLMLSDGTKSMMGPISWQADIPTKSGGSEETIVVPFSDLRPSSGPRKINLEGLELLKAEDMKEIGFMLSLKLSDGSDNPKETFGEGIFGFSLEVISIEPIETLK